MDGSMYSAPSSKTKKYSAAKELTQQTVKKAKQTKS